jgi:cytochrome c oxidase subunit III
MAEIASRELEQLPVGPTGKEGLGWWGMGTLIATEAALFIYLLFAYYYSGAQAQPNWVLEARPDLKLALPNTLLLLVSSLAVWMGERGTRAGRRAQALLGLGGAFVMGCVFVAVQCVECAGKPFSLGTSNYASLYFVTTGLDIAHIVLGLAILLALILWTALGYFSPRRRLSVSVGVLYWYFVTAVWLLVFITYYITPYLGFGR